MLSHVEMDDVPPLMAEDQKDEQQLEINGRHDEEIYRNQLLDVLIEIPGTVSDVTIDGFTLLGQPNVDLNPAADRTIIRCQKDRLTIVNNIMDGARGVLLKGTSQNVLISKNRMIVNKNGIIAQGGAMSNIVISSNVIMPGATVATDPSAIYLTGTTGCQITGNALRGMVSPTPDNRGRGISGSNNSWLSISGNAITDNGYDGISLWGNTTFVTITGNDLSRNGVARPGNGVVIKGQDIGITGNELRGNSDSGIKIDVHIMATLRVEAHDNNIVGNGLYGIWVNTQVNPPLPWVIEPVHAEHNYWGDPTGPYHPTSWTWGSQVITNPGGRGNKVTNLVLYAPWFSGAVGSPPWYKESAIGLIEALADPLVQKHAAEAIEHISKSLDVDLWVDDSHLDPKHGHKVFDEEKKAVDELMLLIADEAIKAACQAAIGKLIDADL